MCEWLTSKNKFWWHQFGLFHSVSPRGKNMTLNLPPWKDNISLASPWVLPRNYWHTTTHSSVKNVHWMICKAALAMNTINDNWVTSTFMAKFCLAGEKPFFSYGQQRFCWGKDQMETIAIITLWTCLPPMQDGLARFLHWTSLWCTWTERGAWGQCIHNGSSAASWNNWTILRSTSA